MKDKKEIARLQAAADKATELAAEANGAYGIPVDPDVAEFMGFDPVVDSFEGHQEEVWDDHQS